MTLWHLVPKAISHQDGSKMTQHLRLLGLTMR